MFIPINNANISKRPEEIEELDKQCVECLEAKAFKLLTLALLEQYCSQGDEDSDNEYNDITIAEKQASDMLLDKSQVHIQKRFHNFKKGSYIQILSERLFLQKKLHTKFLIHFLRVLPKEFIEVDSARPWALYWILHSLYLMHGDEDEPLYSIKSEVFNYLKLLECPSGGYCGREGNIAHIGCTYAAIAILIELGDTDIWNQINRKKIYHFLKQLKSTECPGAFHVHEYGEIDPRASYCVAAVASMLCICTDELFEHTEDYVKSLQTYEGGLSVEPNVEAHLGYTYCGLATLAILGREHVLDLTKLLHYVINRQMDTTGGFEGRINKQTDSCYSFWGGGILSIYSWLKIFPLPEKSTHWFNTIAQQIYILGCCQDTLNDPLLVYKGGFRDKPNEIPEPYHTCYALSGLSLCQYNEFGYVKESIVGMNSNINAVRQIHPLFNISVDKYNESQNFFEKLPKISIKKF